MEIITNDNDGNTPMEYIFYRYVPTMSLAEATLMRDASMKEFFDEDIYYFFNRLISKKQGEGGGTIVLKQLISYIERVGVPLVNTINPYMNSNLQWNDLIEYYVRYGFSKTKENGLLIYHPNKV